MPRMVKMVLCQDLAQVKMRNFPSFQIAGVMVALGIIIVNQSKN